MQRIPPATIGEWQAARACNLTGDEVETAKDITLIGEASAEINDLENREYFYEKLKSIPKV